MTRFSLTVDGTKYDVELGDLSTSPVVVKVNESVYEVEFADGGGTALSTEAFQPEPISPPVAAPSPSPVEPLAKTSPSAGADEVVEVKAPMPGKILAIKAQVGDSVREGDILCTLEAMKMEMTVGSTANGVVTGVRVGVGQTVQFGDALFVLAASG